MARFGTQESEFTIAEADLAQKLISEFAMMNSGILPSVALRGLASVRRNAKRILDRFHRDLDGPFLLHRFMILKSEEAFHQLPVILSEELAAIIENDSTIEGIGDGMMESAIAGGYMDSADIDLINLVKEGAGPKPVLNRLKMSGEVPSPHQRLAALFSSQVNYSQRPRFLGFGTVVRWRFVAEDPWGYGLCLVPACDSLRLKTEVPARFPFWTLLENVYTGQSARRGFTLDVDSGKQLSLAASGSAGAMLWTENFNVDASTKTVVAELKRESQQFGFSGCEREMEWIGQLKPLHAHRIARDITDDLARIGVSEVDWMRAICGGK